MFSQYERLGEGLQGTVSTMWNAGRQLPKNIEHWSLIETCFSKVSEVSFMKLELYLSIFHFFKVIVLIFVLLDKYLKRVLKWSSQFCYASKICCFTKVEFWELFWRGIYIHLTSSFCHLEHVKILSLTAWRIFPA